MDSIDYINQAPLDIIKYIFWLAIDCSNSRAVTKCMRWRRVCKLWRRIIDSLAPIWRELAAQYSSEIIPMSPMNSRGEFVNALDEGIISPLFPRYDVLSLYNYLPTGNWNGFNIEAKIEEGIGMRNFVFRDWIKIGSKKVFKFKVVKKNDVHYYAPSICINVCSVYKIERKLNMRQIGERDILHEHIFTIVYDGKHLSCDGEVIQIITNEQFHCYHFHILIYGHGISICAI